MTNKWFARQAFLSITSSYGLIKSAFSRFFSNFSREREREREKEKKEGKSGGERGKKERHAISFFN